MIIDCARHAGVTRHQDLFAFMSTSWQKHFDRYEWTGAVDLASNHMRVSGKFRHEPIPPYVPGSETDRMILVIPHQGLTVNGWADRLGAKIYVEALNSYGEAHWVSCSSKIAMVVSPHDPAWSADVIRRRGSSPGIGAVCIPLIPDMLGTHHWDPIYDACVERGLPVVIHYSGIEGSYTGTPPLSGSVHQNALSRLILMPHLAESNAASLLLEGVFYRFPALQILFAGFGFKWVPSLMRRVDQEWRNFRSDMPWLLEEPSKKLLSNIWFSSFPIAELGPSAVWEGEFSAALRKRIVFNSHAPFGNETVADVEKLLGKPWAERMMNNGRAFLRHATGAGT